MRFTHLSLLLLAAAATPALAESRLDLRVDTYKAPDGEVYSALRLRAGAEDVSVARDHLIVVDTSASQIGEHRKQALAVLDAYLAALPAGDRIRLYAADVRTNEMGNGFVKPGSAGLEKAVSKLNRRAPLGATNLQRALVTVANDSDAQRATAVLYIGDGMSTADLLAQDELGSLLNDLRTRHIAVHSYAVGPRTDLRLLGTIAQHTGGVVEFDRGRDNVDLREQSKHDPASIGRTLATAARRVVLYVDELRVPADVDIAPRVAMPLRSDRETVVLAKGQLGPQPGVAVRIADRTLSGSAKSIADPANSFVAALWRSSQRTDGLTVAVAGEEMLNVAREAFNDEIESLLAAGDQALALGEFEKAETLAAELRKVDPANVQAGMLLKSARRRQNGRIAVVQLDEDEKPSLLDNLGDDPAPAADPAADPGSLLDDPSIEDPAPAVPADTGELIDQLEAKRRIVTERMQAYVEQVIRDARAELARFDADTAINLVRRARVVVEDARDLMPDARTQMIRRLRGLEQNFESERERQQQRRIQFTERLAALEAEKRLIEAMLLEEEKLAQLIDQVRALLNEGRHGDDLAYEDAEAVAEEAVDLRPGNGPAEAARFTSEAAGHVNKAFRLRKLREDRWLETLYQVELSAVPFPDEPPIRWPAAPVWKALSERRAKWSAVDLRKYSPNEERIRRALRDQTEIQFVDIPLKEAIEFLSDLHDIPIIIDEIALEEEGIPLDEPINRVLSGIQLRSALKIILEPLNLTYIIKDEVMKITSTIVAEELGNLQIRVYPVGDLAIPIVTPSAAGIGQGFGGIGGLGGVGGGFNNGLGGLGGVGGIGGNNIGGGLGGLGGGLFNVPPQPRQRPVPKRDAPAKPAQDPELKDILGEILGDEAASLETFSGQSFAQVFDDAAVAGQKKTR